MSTPLFEKVIDALLAGRAGVVTRRATLYVDHDYVISANLRGQPNRRSKRTEIVLKIGRPNFREREFIKACRKAGEAFPVKKVQLKFYPKR